MRTFIAIEIPPEVKQQLRTEQNRLRDLLALHDLPPVLRWADPDKLHLTLRFLGDTDAIQRRQLQNGLAVIAARHGPFSLAPSRLGCFSSWNNLRVLWVGIGGDSAALQAVQSRGRIPGPAGGISSGAKALFASHDFRARRPQRAPRWPACGIRTTAPGSGRRNTPVLDRLEGR